jgi:hypothetical protein
MIDGEFDMADARATFERLAASGERGKAVFRVADAYAATTARAWPRAPAARVAPSPLLEPAGPRLHAAIAELAGSAPKPPSPPARYGPVANPPS